MATDVSSLRAAMEEIGGPTTAGLSVEQVGAQIVRSARAVLSGAEHVGLVVAQGGTLRTIAATDGLVRTLDRSQDDLKEGPCVDAMAAQTVTLVGDLKADKRWPQYAPHAVEMGIYAQLGVGLTFDPTTVGSLNIYSATPYAFDAGQAEVAAVLGQHAAVSVGRCLKETQLTEALSSRKVIGQALGIVMERFSIPEELAFRYLARLSQVSNTKVRDVATELVTKASQSYAGSTPAGSTQPGNSPRSRKS